MQEKLPSPLRVERRGDVAQLVMCDQEGRNSLGGRMVGALIEALSEANQDPGLRAVVLTNEGSVFCAGANLKERSAAAAGEGQAGGSGRGLGSFGRLLHDIERSPLPVIGCIAGHVVGGGMGLAAALDISVAADDVKFGFSEVRLGVVPAIISVVCLPKMRPGDAREAFLRGNRFPAVRAAEMGLINRAVPREELDDVVAAVVSDIRKGGPKALAAAKQLFVEVPAMSPGDAMDWTAEFSAGLFAGEEAAEGMAAFIEKRKPSWAEPGDSEED
ncbi:MAG: enoyl-CoA hydratase-related protein [Deltaproteobacteria bacterium]